MNRMVNWWNPALTRAIDQFGRETVYDLQAAEAFEVGAASMTGFQFTDLMILHELAHAFGKTHPVGDAKQYNTDIWKACFK